MICALYVKMHNGSEYMATGTSIDDVLGNMVQELHNDFGLKLDAFDCFGIVDNDNSEDLEEKFMAYCENTCVAQDLVNMNKGV